MSGTPRATESDGLHELPYRYAAAVDARDRGALAELFAPGAEVVLAAAITRGHLPQVVTDPAVLIDGVSRFARTFHDVLDRNATVDGERARGETSCRAHHFHERDGRLRDYVMQLRYADEFVRTDAGWRFARRELHLEGAEDVEAAGADEPD